MAFVRMCSHVCCGWTCCFTLAGQARLCVRCSSSGTLLIAQPSQQQPLTSHPAKQHAAQRGRSYTAMSSLSGRTDTRRGTVGSGEVEEEDVASWANTNLAAPGAAKPPVKVGHSGSISMRARPRTISSQTTTFLMQLSKKHLDWNVSSSTALVYALRAVGGINVKADKTLLTIDLPDQLCSQPRVVMVEKESPLKTILLDSIVGVTYDKTDESKRSLRLVYWFDKNRKPQGPPTHPPSPSAAAASANNGAAPAVVNIANASSKAKQFLLSLSFASHLDARDVYQCLNYMISYGCSSAADLFRLTADAPAEFIILHSGFLEKKGKVSVEKSHEGASTCSCRLGRSPLCPLLLSPLSRASPGASASPGCTPARDSSCTGRRRATSR